jgi:hypothetical protein
MGGGGLMNGESCSMRSGPGFPRARPAGGRGLVVCLHFFCGVAMTRRFDADGGFSCMPAGGSSKWLVPYRDFFRLHLHTRRIVGLAFLVPAGEWIQAHVLAGGVATLVAWSSPAGAAGRRDRGLFAVAMPVFTERLRSGLGGGDQTYPLSMLCMLGGGRWDVPTGERPSRGLGRGSAGRWWR